MTEVAMRCPCGAAAVVELSGSYNARMRWGCTCPNCYSDSRPNLIGYGEDQEQAIAEWWERTELEYQVDWWPARRPNETVQAVLSQVAEEMRRTRGWVLRDGVFTPGEKWWGPSLAQMAGES
jgi:uncharacterized phage-associated protein